MSGPPRTLARARRRHIARRSRTTCREKGQQPPRKPPREKKVNSRRDRLRLALSLSEVRPEATTKTPPRPRLPSPSPPPRPFHPLFPRLRQLLPPRDDIVQDVDPTRRCGDDETPLHRARRRRLRQQRFHARPRRGRGRSPASPKRFRRRRECARKSPSRAAPPSLPAASSSRKKCARSKSNSRAKDANAPAVHRGGESRGVRAQTFAKIRGENGKNPARATRHVARASWGGERRRLVRRRVIKRRVERRSLPPRRSFPNRPRSIEGIRRLPRRGPRRWRRLLRLAAAFRFAAAFAFASAAASSTAGLARNRASSPARVVTSSRQRRAEQLRRRRRARVRPRECIHHEQITRRRAQLSPRERFVAQRGGIAREREERRPLYRIRLPRHGDDDVEMIGKRRHELERVRERAFRDVPRRGSTRRRAGTRVSIERGEEEPLERVREPRRIGGDASDASRRRALARAKKMPQQTRKHGLRLGRGLETRIGRARRARQALRHPDQRGCRALSERHTHRVRLAIKLQLGVGKRVGRAARRPRRFGGSVPSRARRAAAAVRRRGDDGRSARRDVPHPNALRAVRPPRPSRVRVARRRSGPARRDPKRLHAVSHLALPRRRNTRIRTLRVLETHER